MARPNKQGVDYFPLDVHLDDKFKFIEIKYKLEGFAILVKLLQRIYSQGYWCKWTEDELLLFSDEAKADYSFVQNVVDECLKRGVFNKDLHDKHNILTSTGIQKRYKEIVRRRKDVEVTSEYLLVKGSFGVNDDINPSSSKQDDDKSTQSKVKETKVKEKTTTSGGENPFDFYVNNLGQLSPYMIDNVTQWCEELSDELVIESMKLALSNGKQFKYAEGILKKWKQNGVSSLEDVQAEQKQHERDKPKTDETERAEKLKELRQLVDLGVNYFKKRNREDDFYQYEKELRELE